ncbi:MAG: sugar transferase [Nocardioides sp.]
MGDRTMAVALLVVCAPVLVVVLALVRVLDGPGVLYRQDRLGRGKVPFEILKIRTMRDGAVTSLGGLLRGAGVDELPQLVNVVRGEMCLIGPRPLTAYDVERLGWDGPERVSRWSVAPGLTGLAQFAPVCDQELSWRLDHRYARERCLRLHLTIVAASIASLVFGKRRVKNWLFAGEVR